MLIARRCGLAQLARAVPHSFLTRSAQRACSLQALNKWEERLEAIFEGRPYDNLDAALTDTANQFPVHIQPFRDMIDGMRSDLVKSRYRTYDELYEYCYKVAGTVALMVMPVMGLDPAYKARAPAHCRSAPRGPAARRTQVVAVSQLHAGVWPRRQRGGAHMRECAPAQGPLEPVYRAALSLGVANQLTNILRDVGEDIRERNRIYVPLDTLQRFGIAEADVVGGMHSTTTGTMDDRWIHFMQYMARLRPLLCLE